MSTPTNPSLACFGRDALREDIALRLAQNLVVALTSAFDEPGLGTTTLLASFAATAKRPWAWHPARHGVQPHARIAQTLKEAGVALPKKQSLEQLYALLAKYWKRQPPDLLVFDGIMADDIAALQAIIGLRPRDCPVLLTTPDTQTAVALGAHQICVPPLADDAVDAWVADALPQSSRWLRAWKPLLAGRPLAWSIVLSGPIPPLPDDILVDGPPALVGAYTARTGSLDRTSLRVLRSLASTGVEVTTVQRATQLARVDAQASLTRLAAAGLLVSTGHKAHPFRITYAVAQLAAQQAVQLGLSDAARRRQQLWVAEPNIAVHDGLADALDVIMRLHTQAPDPHQSAHLARLRASLHDRVPDIFTSPPSSYVRANLPPPALAASQTDDIELIPLDAAASATPSFAQGLTLEPDDTTRRISRHQLQFDDESEDASITTRRIPRDVLDAVTAKPEQTLQVDDTDLSDIPSESELDLELDEPATQDALSVQTAYPTQTSPPGTDTTEWPAMLSVARALRAHLDAAGVRDDDPERAALGRAIEIATASPTDTDIRRLDRIIHNARERLIDAARDAANDQAHELREALAKLDAPLAPLPAAPNSPMLDDAFDALRTTWRDAERARRRARDAWALLRDQDHTAINTSNLASARSAHTDALDAIARLNAANDTWNIACKARDAQQREHERQRLNSAREEMDSTIRSLHEQLRRIVADPAHASVKDMFQESFHEPRQALAKLDAYIQSLPTPIEGASVQELASQAAAVEAKADHLAKEADVVDKLIMTAKERLTAESSRREVALRARLQTARQRTHAARLASQKSRASAAHLETDRAGQHLKARLEHYTAQAETASARADAADQVDQVEALVAQAESAAQFALETLHAIQQRNAGTQRAKAVSRQALALRVVEHLVHDDAVTSVDRQWRAAIVANSLVLQLPRRKGTEAADAALDGMWVALADLNQPPPPAVLALAKQLAIVRLTRRLATLFP